MSTRQWDLAGDSPSSERRLYHTRQSATKTAGYVGLRDTHQLRDFYTSATWKSIFDPYLDKHNNGINGKLFTNPKPLSFIRRMKTAAAMGYGTTTPDTVTWDDKDWACHFVVLILNSQSTFTPQPMFGPHQGEEELESWNRAYQLLLCALHYRAEDKKDILYNDDAKKNKTALKPRFMNPSAPTAATPTPAAGIDRRPDVVNIVHLKEVLQEGIKSLVFPDPASLKTDLRRLRRATI